MNCTLAKAIAQTYIDRTTPWDAVLCTRVCRLNLSLARSHCMHSKNIKI